MPTNYADESDVRAVLAQLRAPANRALRMGTAADPFARMVWADLFDDMGRSHEAALLRDPTRHVTVTPAGEVVPARFNRPGLDALAERLSQALQGLGVGDDYSNMASDWRERLETEPEPLRAEDLQHMLADHFYHGVLHSGPMSGDLLADTGMDPPDWPAVAQDMRRMLMDYPYEEPDIEVPAPTAYGTREDLLGAIAQNPWESDIHARLSDWEGEYGDSNEAAFRAKVAQWLPERVRFGANPTPEIGNVLPWIHGPYQGLPWGDRPPHYIHTWFEDEDLIGGGRRRLLAPRFDSRSQPVWARVSSDPLSPSAANEAFFALPRGRADSLNAVRAALPEFDFNAHENRPLNDAEQAYIGLTHLDPDTDPEIWPQLEAILRERNRRGLRFGDDQAPTNYGDRESLEAAILQNPLEPDIHLRLADLHAEQGDDLHARFRQAVGEGLHRRLTTPFTPSSSRDHWNQPLSPEWRPGSHAWARPPRISLWFPEGPRHNPYMGPNPYVNSWIPWQPLDGDAWAWGYEPMSGRNVEAYNIRSALGLSPWLEPDFAEDFPQWRNDVWSSARSPSWGAPGGGVDLYDPDSPNWLNHAEMNAFGFSNISEMDPALWPQVEAILRREFARGRTEFAGDGEPTEYGPPSPFVRPEDPVRYPPFVDQEDFVPYGDREALEAAIRANPLNVDPHLMLADWFRENDQEPEGDFRELVGRSVQRRLKNPWTDPQRSGDGTLVPGPHGPVDEFTQIIHDRDRGYRTFRPFKWSDIEPWMWAGSGWPLRPETQVPPAESGPFPTLGQYLSGRAALGFSVDDLHAAERAYAGIDDLTTISPEMWPLVEQIMRQQHGRGLRFEDSETPTNYGDVEDLRAQMMLDPRVSDVHLRLADALREAGDETEGDFSEAVGRSLQRRFSQPWQPPRFDRWGFLHQGSPWMPEDDYAEHVTGDPMETGWGTYSPSTTHHVMWPALSGAHNTQLVGNSGWGQPPGGELIWDFAHEHGGLSGPDRLDLPPHIDWPATLSDLPTVSAWRNGRWAHPDVEAPWVRPDEMDHPDAHPHVMSQAERLFAGTMDPGAIGPRNWPQLEALMREMHSRGVRFQGGRPTAYSHQEDEGPEESDPMEPEEPEEPEEPDYEMWDVTDSDIPDGLRPREVISDLSAFYETADGDQSEVVVESATFNWNGEEVTAYRWRDWDGVNDYGGWTLDRYAAAADARAEADSRHVEPDLRALDLVRELFPEADRDDEGDWIVNMAGRQLAFEARHNGDLILNFFNDANQETEAAASAKDLRAGSIDLMRAVRRVAQEAMRRGIPFGYGVPSDKRRARIYGEFLAAGGYVPRERLSRNAIVWEPSDGSDPARDAARVRQYFETIDRYGVVDRYAGPSPVAYHDPSAAVRYAVVSRLFRSRFGVH